MASSKRSIVEQTIDFIETILDVESGKGGNPNAIAASISAFRKSVMDYNDDPSIEESRPFMLINAQIDEFPDELVINKVLLAADDQGLSSEFKKVVVGENVMLYFSHKARTFVDEYVTQQRLGYMNILSNGIVFDDLAIVGFYTATEQRLRAALVEAKIALAA